MTFDISKLVPVEMADGYYIVSEDWLIAGLPFPPLSEADGLIRSGYKRRSGTLHMEGLSHPATIFTPPDGDDQIFAAPEKVENYSQDADDAAEISDVTEGELGRFWSEVHSRFGKAEGIIPEQRVQIIGGFVEPRLSVGTDHEEPISWGELRKHNYLLVSGAPGSGKTTLLRHWLLWHANSTHPQHGEILPICLSLRHYRPDTPVETALRKEAVETGAPWLGRDIKAYAAQGKLAIAFDGLDELPSEDRDQAIEQISTFTSRYPTCRYMVTTRPDVGLHLHVGLKKARILPFDRSRARQLAYHRLYETGTWKTFTSKVEAEPALDWIAGNPLALSLMIGRYLRREIAPSYVGEIIAAVVDMFVDSWDSSRGIIRTRQLALSPAEKRKILSGLVSIENSLESSNVQLLNGIRRSYDQTALLSMIGEHTGLIVRENASSWKFTSSVLEDYFKATSLVSKLASQAANFRNLLRKPLTAVESQVARFIGFMSSDAGDQIDEILKRSHASELSTAVRLTDVLSQGLTVRPSTLIAYSSYVAATLRETIRASRDVPSSVKSAEPFTLELAFAGQSSKFAEECAALLAALHRSRESAGAEALIRFIEANPQANLDPVRALLRADGELKVEIDRAMVTCKVSEILPAVPAGPNDLAVS